MVAINFTVFQDKILDGSKCQTIRQAARCKPGDRLQPQGMGGHSVRLNELMINLKAPRGARAGWPVLVGRSGIAWACGLRVDERAAIGPQTAAVWHVIFERTARGGEQD